MTVQGETARCRTLYDIARWRAHCQPDRTAYIFQHDDGTKSVTYRVLDLSARAIAAWLQSVAGSGDRVLIICKPGLEYITAFLGCLYAGAVAVPAYPPRNNRHLIRLQSILVDAEVSAVLTGSPLAAQAHQHLSGTRWGESHRWLAVDQVHEEIANGWREPEVSSKSLAFLQYTSGSTGSPKGVMLTHGNLLYNSKLITEKFEVTHESRAVSWLPPFHDMGLIGGVLQPLFAGFPCTLMSPVSVLQRPMRWLEAITQYKATISGGPNFMYDLCVRKSTAQERESLDLSSWDLAFTGAEPVRPDTLGRFAEAFGPGGFRRQAFYPCYGLAEATLFVTGGLKASEPVTCTIDKGGLARNEAVITASHGEAGQRLVGCGLSAPGQQVIIANSDSRTPCLEGSVGEIWVRGQSVALGYWNQPELTAQVFGGYLAGSEEGPFLRTGDLGFMLRGELFVTGRLKDLIIIRGRNHYPSDIEQTVEGSHPALKPGACAAFSVEAAGEERLVVVQEADRHFADLYEVIRAIRQAVAEEHELQVYAVVLIGPASIPKTSSGKIQRYACRAGFLDNTLSVLAQDILGITESDQVAGVPSTGSEESGGAREALLGLDTGARLAVLEDFLRTVIGGSLAVPFDQIDLQVPVTALGMDSITALTLTGQIQSEYGAEVSIDRLFQGISIGDLAVQVLAQVEACAGTEPILPYQADRGGVIPELSFAEQRIWLLQQANPKGVGYNIPVFLHLKGPLNRLALEQAFGEIVKRHDRLRTAYIMQGGRPVAQSQAPAPVTLPFVNLSELPRAEAEAEAERLAVREARTPFDLSRGPLYRVVLFRIEPDVHKLLLTVHHIVADGWSVVVLVRELAEQYGVSAGGGPLSALPALPLQYADHASRQRLQTDKCMPHLAYWRGKLAGAPAALYLPTDNPRPARLSGTGARRLLVLPHELMNSLHSFCRRSGMTPFMAMLAAFYAVMFRWTRQNDLLVGTVAAMRNRPEVQALIGCFINFLPLRTTITGDLTIGELLERVRETVLEARAHEEVPFERILDAVKPARMSGQNRLFNVAFVMQNFRMPRNIRLDDQLEATFVELLDTGASLLDLRFIVGEKPSDYGISLECEYQVDLFQAGTIDRVLQAHQTVLSQFVQDPDIRLSDLVLPAAMEAGSSDWVGSPTLAVASTFTAEPLEDSLAFWIDKLGTPSRIVFAPYNQVFQQLLDPNSLLAGNRKGANIVLVRFEDWLRYKTDGAVRFANAEAHIRRSAADLADGLRAATTRTAIPFLVCLCPESPRVDEPLRVLFGQVEAQIRSDLQGVTGVYVLTAAELLSLYPVSEYYDAPGDRLGHIPYTPIFFSALGTMLVRKLYGIPGPQRKVIVLDCDETLWSGVCGEDGPHGVLIDKARQWLQQFMVAQHEAGMLVCLCTKNHEDDVFAVFNERPEMLLRKEHLVSWKINWKPKSENLKELAEELGLGLDSFIFIDDNPLECTEVQVACPEVLTLQLPSDPSRIRGFLNHVWEFDHDGRTDEDRKRTGLYKQNIQRERLRRESPGLAQFIERLELSIQIHAPSHGQLPRVAQLTQRTNQFNTTTIRRSQAEIGQLCSHDGYHCLVTEVSDRFGEYGLVGVVVYRAVERALEVDTFLLSCRVLGRGVEHRIVARLGETAQQMGLETVCIAFVPSKKNQPALNFLESVGAQHREAHGAGFVYRFTSEQAARVQFAPGPDDTTMFEVAAADLPVEANSDWVSVTRANETLVQIALELHQADLIHEQVRNRRMGLFPVRPQTAYVAPRGPVEATLAETWADVLCVPRVGVYDDFFELGGDSLMAVQILYRVHQSFGLELPVSSIFVESLTVAALAEVIANAEIQLASPGQVADLLARIDELSNEEVRILLERMTESDG